MRSSPGTFRKNIADIAWEKEVWLMNAPEHMIRSTGRSL
jgi:BsuBI/PstI restriction endonuclease domain